MVFQDEKGSKTVPSVFKEIIKNEIGLIDIKLNKFSTVIDIGANVGIPSIFLAKKFPHSNFLIFEPVRENFENLLKNIEANNVKNIKAHNLAVTSDGRKFDMNVVLNDNSGGATGQITDLDKNKDSKHFRSSDSVTLDSIFEENKLKYVDLLKIDCEGSEHEILNSFSYLKNVRRVIGEVHINEPLKSKGYSFESFIELLNPLGEKNFKIKVIKMAE